MRIVYLFDEGIQVLEGTEFFVLAFGVLFDFVFGGFELGLRDIYSSLHNVTILMILFIPTVRPPK